MTTNRRIKDISSFLSAVFIIVLLNYIGSYIYYRFDLTSEKRYTLSKPTLQLLDSLQDEVLFKVYLEGEFPAGFRLLRNRTREMLEEFSAYSDNRIKFLFIDPNANPDKKQRQNLYRELYKAGLKPTTLEVNEKAAEKQQIIFPGAIVSSGERQEIVQLLKSRMGSSAEVMLNNSVQDLEYELANAIRKISKPDKPAIAFLHGNGELDSLDTYDIFTNLSEFYTVNRDSIQGRIGSLNRYKCIIVAKPSKAWTDKDKFILDQYIMKGGKVIWLIDNVVTSMDSLQRQATTFALPAELNLEDLLFSYGVRINTDLIQDLQGAPIPVNTGMIGNQPQMKFFPWYYFPLIFPENRHPIVNNLNAIKTEFASSIDTVKAAGITKTPLLFTSKYSRLQNSPVRVSLNILGTPPEEAQFNKPKRLVAVLLEGSFHSAFDGYIPTAIAESKDIGFIKQGKQTAQIVISDGDLIRNGVNRKNGTYTALGYDRYTQRDYGNKNFILNCISYLCDDSGLISARDRDVKLRLLDRKKLENERFFWQLVNVVFPIILTLFFGLSIYRLRKKNYSANTN